MLIKINSPSYGCCHCVRCECRGRVYTSLHLVGEREVVTLWELHWYIYKGHGWWGLVGDSNRWCKSLFPHFLNCPHYCLISQFNNHHLSIIKLYILNLSSIKYLHLVAKINGLHLPLSHSLHNLRTFSPHSMPPSHFNCQFCRSTSQPCHHTPMPLVVYSNTSSITFTFHQPPSHFNFQLRLPHCFFSPLWSYFPIYHIFQLLLHFLCCQSIQCHRIQYINATHYPLHYWVAHDAKNGRESMTSDTKVEERKLVVWLCETKLSTSVVRSYK